MQHTWRREASRAVPSKCLYGIAAEYRSSLCRQLQCSTQGEWRTHHRPLLTHNCLTRSQRPTVTAMWRDSEETFRLEGVALEDLITENRDNAVRWLRVPFKTSGLAQPNGSSTTLMRRRTIKNFPENQE